MTHEEVLEQFKNGPITVTTKSGFSIKIKPAYSCCVLRALKKQLENDTKYGFKSNRTPWWRFWAHTTG